MSSFFSSKYDPKTKLALEVGLGVHRDATIADQKRLDVENIKAFIQSIKTGQLDHLSGHVHVINYSFDSQDNPFSQAREDLDTLAETFSTWNEKVFSRWKEKQASLALFTRYYAGKASRVYSEGTLTMYHEDARGASLEEREREDTAKRNYYEFLRALDSVLAIVEIISAGDNITRLKGLRHAPGILRTQIENKLRDRFQRSKIYQPPDKPTYQVSVKIGDASLPPGVADLQEVIWGTEDADKKTLEGLKERLNKVVDTIRATNETPPTSRVTYNLWYPGSSILRPEGYFDQIKENLGTVVNEFLTLDPISRTITPVTIHFLTGFWDKYCPLRTRGFVGIDGKYPILSAVNKLPADKRGSFIRELYDSRYNISGMKRVCEKFKHYGIAPEEGPIVVNELKAFIQQTEENYLRYPEVAGYLIDEVRKFVQGRDNFPVVRPPSSPEI